ncbi:MAG: ATP-dependent zinc metalloprotease FtsH, partial [Methylomonas sp.]
LKEHIDILHNMAHALLDWETIDKYQIDELMQGRTIAPPEPHDVTDQKCNEAPISADESGLAAKEGLAVS